MQVCVSVCGVSIQERRSNAFLSPGCVQVPFYKGEHITFDVEPEKLDFEVMHDSVLFEVSTVAVLCVYVCEREREREGVLCECVCMCVCERERE